MTKVVTIGSVSKDIFFPTNEGIILDTPEDLLSQKKIAFELGAKYQVKERHEALGGCAANVAHGLVKLGQPTQCYTKIGNDELGKWIKKAFLEGGVGIEMLEIEDDCKSDLSVVLVDADSGQRTIFSDRDANDRLVVAYEKFKNPHWMFVSSLNGDWQSNLRELLRIAKEKKIAIAFNPGQKNIKTDLAAVASAVMSSEILFINKDEAVEIVSGLGEITVRELLENEEYLVKILCRFGAKTVVLTDGERGAWTYDGKQLLHAEALLQKAIDTTGAGDAFTSGFFAAQLAHHDLETSLRWGIANSSQSVLEYGGQKGLLDEKAIELVANKVLVKVLN